MASDARSESELHGESFSLAPPAELPPPPPPPGAERPAKDELVDADSRQFSLTGLLVVMGLAGLILVPARFLPPSMYAGFLGIAAAVLLPVVTLLRAWPIAHVAWWLLLGLYVAAMGYAVLQVPQ